MCPCCARSLYTEQERAFWKQETGCARAQDVSQQEQSVGDQDSCHGEQLLLGIRPCAQYVTQLCACWGDVVTLPMLHTRKLREADLPNVAQLVKEVRMG